MLEDSEDHQTPTEQPPQEVTAENNLAGGKEEEPIDPPSREEQLLEAFPLNKLELDQILRLEGYFHKSSEFEGLSPFESVDGTPLPEKFTKDIVECAIDNAFVFGANTDDDDDERQRKYLEGIAICLGRRGQRSVLDLLFTFSLAKTDVSEVETTKILSLVKGLILATENVLHGCMEEEVNLDTPKPWVKSIKSNSITRPKWIEWATWTMPHIYTSLSTFMHLVLLGAQHPFRPQAPPLLLPQLNLRSILWQNANHDFPITLACLSPFLGKTWRRLYSNDVDGESFPVFLNAILAYSGPTVILIRTTTNDVFGFYTSCPWKKSRKWYGEGADSFLFCLSPFTALYPRTGQGKYYQYLNTPLPHDKGTMRGLAIGGVSYDRPRLHINESFENCRISPVDTTFESGPLLADDLQGMFDVDVIEVFAVNATKDDYEASIKSGALQIAIYEATRKKAAVVDRGQFLEDFAGGAFLNRGFEHRNHASGRHEFRTGEE